MKKGDLFFLVFILLIIYSSTAGADPINFDFLSPEYNYGATGPVITFNCSVTEGSGNPFANILSVTIGVYYGTNTTDTFLTSYTESGLSGLNNGTEVTLDLSDSLRNSGLDVSSLSGNPIFFTYNCSAISDTAGQFTSGNVMFQNSLMSFYGYVKNSTYSSASGANVSLSEFIMPEGPMPPTINLITSTLTNGSGYYSFFLNGTYMEGQTNLKIEVKINGSDENITEIGPVLPPLPGFAIMNYFANGTLYLQPAATLRLSATYTYENSSVGHEFNYEVTDMIQGLGMWNSIMTAVPSYTDVVVPRDRNYSVTWMRNPEVFGFDDAVPPLSMTVDNISSYSNTNYVIELTKDLTYDEYLLSGYIKVNGNTTPANCTDMIIKLTPGNGEFVPPGSTVDQEWNITESDVPEQDFKYDVTLMGATDGINYVIEWYCSGTDEYFAAIRKVQMYDANNESYNVTATALSGSYDTSGNYMSNKINTSTKCIQIYDLTNESQPSTSINNLNVEFEVKDNSFGTLNYVTQVSSGAAVNWTFLETSTVKIKIFSQQFPPYKTRIDLSKDYCGPDANISLKPFNMETIDEEGNKKRFDSLNLRMRFMRNSAECNVVSPDDICMIGDTLEPNSFNPMQAMMAGKVNLMIDLAGGAGAGTALYFINVDMISSGPPDAIMSENASFSEISPGSMDQIWQFGSFAPDIYDYVLIGIPYDQAQVNEDWLFSTEMPVIYDENWNAVWNTTENGTDFDAITGNYSDYADYPSSWFTGMNCSDTDSQFINTYCYINKSENKFWLKIPHFSGGKSKLTGSSVLTVTLESPEDNAYNSTTNLIDFTYNVTNGTVLNCSLIINDQINMTDTSMASELPGQNFTVYLPNADYLWSINCTDTYNGIEASETRNISISYAAAPNTAPNFDFIAGFTLNEDFGTFTINLQDNVSDAEDPDGALTYNWTVSNTSRLTLDIPNSSGIATFTSQPNASGSVTIVISVVDTGGLSNSTQFTITVTPQDDSPWWDLIGNSTASINEDSTNNNISSQAYWQSYFRDVEQDQIPNAVEISTNISDVSCSFSLGDIICNAANNFTGLAIITLSADDETFIITQDFEITVNAVNDSPWLDQLANITLDEDNGTSTIYTSAEINQSFRDVENDQAPLTITIIQQTNTSVISCLSDNGIACTTVANESGVSTIVVELNDSGGLSVSEPITITVTPVNDQPWIELDKPANNTMNLSTNTIDFIYTPYDVEGISNCSLVINDITNVTDTSITSGTSSNLTTYLPDGEYLWKIICIDIDNAVANSELRNISVTLDVTAPSINLESPAYDSMWTSSSTVSFSYNVSDGSNIVNCSLILNYDDINSTSTSITKDAAGQTFSASLANAEYNWSVNCTDENGNIGGSEIWNVTVNYVAANETTTTGGGGGTSVSGGLYADTAQGVIIELGVGDRASFEVKGKEHTITVMSITPDAVTFKIMSEPITVVVEKNTTKEVDVDRDGINDISITVNNIDIRYMTAEFYIKQIEKPIVAPTIPTVEETLPKQLPEEAPTVIEEKKTFEEKPEWVQVFVVVVTILVLAMAALYISLAYKSKKKEKESRL